MANISYYNNRLLTNRNQIIYLYEQNLYFVIFSMKSPLVQKLAY
jgi:hypothetical protein